MGCKNLGGSSYITKDYLETLRAMHASRPWGKSGRRFINTILPFYDYLGCKSLLDYGSGAETVRKYLEANRPDIDVRCYDPGVLGREVEPEPADFVVSTDVLEHVEEQFVVNVLKHMYQLANLGCFLNIALVPAKRILPDGRNAHITLRPWQWWMNKIETSPWYHIVHDAKRKHLLVWLVK